jgi:hypothetical protein
MLRSYSTSKLKSTDFFYFLIFFFDRDFFLSPIIFRSYHIEISESTIIFRFRYFIFSHLNQ